MREIKFRVWGGGMMWYKETKTIDGNDTVLRFFNGGIGWGLYDMKLEYRLVTGDPKAIFNTPGVLMQYTGLKDKSGKDIYEGDILKKWQKGQVHSMPHNFKQMVGSIKEVIYHEGGFKLTKSNRSQNYGLNSFMIRYYGLEIIGNIYENTDLLNSEQNAQESDTTEAK